MSFIHEDPEFDDLIRIVASACNLSLGLIEKDYWVTHTLWSLHEAGFEVWFKGGTSLSKGFGLIERFSEDLDLKIEPGTATALPLVSNWKSEGTKATTERKAYFEKLPALLVVPGAEVKLDSNTTDKSWRSANVRVTYPGGHLSDLGGVLRPYVLLEIGSARVTPSVERDMTSFVHEHLASQNQLHAFVDNRPRAIRCIHPLVTLLEKLDALHRRIEKADPPGFVRHFEDAAKIIAAESRLPVLAEHKDVRELAEDMQTQKQIARLPASTDPAFAAGDSPRWQAIRDAYTAIALMYWGERIPLEVACASIRQWIKKNFED